MIVKLTQELARGFAPWKEMFFENESELNALGAKPVSYTHLTLPTILLV